MRQSDSQSIRQTVRVSDVKQLNPTERNFQQLRGKLDWLRETLCGQR